jgi:hypothetical protein
MCDSKYCMVYVKLTNCIKTFKDYFTLKYNYQKDEWFIKIRNVEEAIRIGGMVRKCDFIDMEFINMDEVEKDNIYGEILLRLI